MRVPTTAEAVEDTGIRFFDSLDAWRRDIDAAYPKAEFETQALSDREVSRAFAINKNERVRVGVFGNLKGLGYVVSFWAAHYINNTHNVRKHPSWMPGVVTDRVRTGVR